VTTDAGKPKLGALQAARARSGWSPARGRVFSPSHSFSNPPEYGAGFEGIFARPKDALEGVLHGIDSEVWSPSRDEKIAAPLAANDLGGKRRCSEDLLRQFGLPADLRQTPLAGIVSRLVAQKGFDLLAQVLASLVTEGLAVVVLGTGEPAHEECFGSLAVRFPTRVGVRIGFDDALAHKVTAGADMLLMPSRFEPCGLNQMYAMAYDTLPVPSQSRLASAAWQIRLMPRLDSSSLATRPKPWTQPSGKR
jgi:glycogen synthase